MAKPPESTKTSLRQRLAARTRERWPQLEGIEVRYRSEFAYVAGKLDLGLRRSTAECRAVVRGLLPGG